jgi:hypothetical protein
MNIVNNEDPLFVMNRKDLLGKLSSLLRLKADVRELLEEDNVKAAKLVLETWWGCACGHREWAVPGCWVCEVLEHDDELHYQRASISEPLRGSVYDTDRKYLLGEVSVLLRMTADVLGCLVEGDEEEAQELLESWDRHDHGHPEVDKDGAGPECWRCELGWLGTKAIWDAQNEGIVPCCLDQQKNNRRG